MPITYAIEEYEITSLTWPMWQACGLECPAMIGAPCKRESGKFCTLYKFDTAAAEVVYSWTLDSGQSDECGDAGEGAAWFALFVNPDASEHTGPMGAGVILCVLSGGAVSATRFDTAAELNADWEKLLAEDAVADN